MQRLALEFGTFWLSEAASGPPPVSACRATAFFGELSTADAPASNEPSVTDIGTRVLACNPMVSICQARWTGFPESAPVTTAALVTLVSTCVTRLTSKLRFKPI